MNRSLGFSCLFLLKFAEVLFRWKNADRHETNTFKLGFEVLGVGRLKDVLLNLTDLRGSKDYLEKTFWKNLTAFN